MMTALLVLSVVNIVGSVACLGLLVLRRAPAPMDPAAIARAILRSPFDAVDVRDAMQVAQEVADQPHPVITLPPIVKHYVVQHTIGGITKIVYDGHDSDRAYAAHVEMETHPDRYPGRHQYLENGRARVDRLHSEIES